MFLTEIFIVFLTDSPDIYEVCLSSGRENYLFFPFFCIPAIKGYSPESPFKLVQEFFFFLSQATQSFLNLFGHYPNFSPKSVGNLFYFSALGFGKGYHLQTNDR